MMALIQSLLKYFNRTKPTSKNVHKKEGPSLSYDFGKSKLHSLSYSSIIDSWVFLHFHGQTVIVLTNINVQAKNIEFWAKIPPEQKIKFVNDVSILKCKDRREMFKLLGNIGQDFADAKGYIDGIEVASNMEGSEK